MAYFLSPRNTWNASPLGMTQVSSTFFILQIVSVTLNGNNFPLHTVKSTNNLSILHFRYNLHLNQFKIPLEHKIHSFYAQKFHVPQPQLNLPLPPQLPIQPQLQLPMNAPMNTPMIVPII